MPMNVGFTKNSCICIMQRKVDICSMQCDLFIIVITLECYYFSLVAHKDSVSTMTSNNYAYYKIIDVEIHQVHDSYSMDSFVEG